MQHCVRAVDDDTFQRMVERQYELLRKERIKGSEEPMSVTVEAVEDAQSKPEVST